MEKAPIKNEEIAQNPDALQSTEKQGSKPKNGSKIATIICAILAVAGLGFGIYGFFFKKSEAPTQNTDTANLESELSSLKQKYSVLQNYVKELEASGTEVSEEVKSATTAETIATKDYIYVGEWGIKIRIPETVKDVSYVYESFTNGSSAVYVNGHSSDDPTDYSEQAYDDSESHSNPSGKAAVSLHEVGEDRLGPTGDISGQKYGIDYGTIINIGGKQKVIDITGPQVSWWMNIKDQVDSGKLILNNWNYEERVKWEGAASSAIQKMLSDPSNYSAI